MFYLQFNQIFYYNKPFGSSRPERFRLRPFGFLKPERPFFERLKFLPIFKIYNNYPIMKIDPIEAGNYYHIYNRGINGTPIFNETENYYYFLRLYEKHIEPITETYAWCLMGNHFHLLVWMKELDEIKKLPGFEKANLSGLQDPKGLAPITTNLSGFENPKGLSTRQKNDNFIFTNQFSKFFNAYAKAFNKRYKRTGSLFEKPFERKLVNNLNYFKTLIFYVHYNPVFHHFCERLQDYSWTSYGSVISLKPTKIERDKIIGYFDNVGNFIDFHKQKHEFNELRDLLFD
ncbi:MAG: hypothetical protein U0W24_15285 [Bacteroidales bacterium]